MKLRTVVNTAVLLALFGLPPLRAAGPQGSVFKTQVSVFKTKTCGCCGKWVDHLKANGFAVTVHDVPSTAEFRKKYGVPENLQSCHTAVVGGYSIEGHVPAADIHRLLKSKAKGRGLAVPGMPMGSPGMEGPRKDAYSVLLFQDDGRVTAFQKY